MTFWFATLPPWNSLTLSRCSATDFWIQVDVFEPLHQPAHERFARLRLLLDGCALARDYVTEHLHPVILVQHAVDLEALRPQARRDAAEEISLRLDLFLDQRLDQRRRIHGHLVHLLIVDAGGFDESRPELKVTAADVEGDRLALEILRLGDAVLLQRENAHGRTRPDPGDGHQVEPTRRTVHHDGEIEDAEIILPLVHRHAHPARAESAIDGHVETALVPETHLLRDECIAEGPQRQPRQRHLDGRRGTHDCMSRQPQAG